MKKKVFKGWTGKMTTLNNVCGWYVSGYKGDYKSLQIDFVIKQRGLKQSWHEDNWPPKRVKVTVEVDDGTD